MQDTGEILQRIQAINERAAFNRWCGIEVTHAEPGAATIAMPWRDESGQYAGFLHAGLIGALVDTACGFAAATLVEQVLASHYSVNCLRPARGHPASCTPRVRTARCWSTGETLLSVVGQA